MIAIHTQARETLLDLLRRAAIAGPGLNNLRHEVSDSERISLAAEFRTLGEEPPSYLLQPTQWIDRQAKLFEAGDYPDKHLSVTDSDIARLVQNFDIPIPVLIEHSDSPLELGFVTELRQQGKELYGTITLTQQADSLMIKSGASSLSIGLESDLSRIREVSVVRNPRVPSAQIFHLSPVFSAHFTDFDYAAACNQEQQRLAFNQAEITANQWINEGKLTPASKSLLKALLACQATVNFNQETISVGALVARLKEFLPSQNIFAELAPVHTPQAAIEQAAHHLLLPEEAAFYRKHFPGIDLKTIAAGKSTH